MKYVKRKKSAPTVTEHDVEKYVNDIFGHIKVKKDIDKCDAKHSKVLKILIGVKKIQLYFSFKMSLRKWEVGLIPLN